MSTKELGPLDPIFAGCTLLKVLYINVLYFRGFEPNAGAPKPALEWEAWLKGTRRFPPSDEEIALNRQRQQTQLAEDAVTEKRAPKIGSTGKGAADIDRPKSYPKYDDLEINPGVRKTNQD